MAATRKNTKKTNIWQKWFGGQGGRKKLLLLILVLAFGGIGIWQLAFSSAANLNDGTIRLLRTTASSSATAQKCLDTYNYGTANLTPVQIFDCRGTDNQKWYRSASGALVLQAYSSTDYKSKCLDVKDYGVANGSPVQIYDCQITPNQIWDIYGDGTIRSRASGRCLSTVGDSVANYTRLEIRDCSGSFTQQWQNNLMDMYYTSSLSNYKCTSTATLKQNSKGNCVYALQWGLNNWGPATGNFKKYTINGIYGTATVNAVKKFQTVKKLPVTGIVDQPTWDQLLNDCNVFNNCPTPNGK